MANQLSHLNEHGHANMVDVSNKSVTKRQAIAQATVVFPRDVYQQLALSNGQTAKGAITDIARVAGIMGAKKTSDLIPLCHPLPLEKVAIEFTFDDDSHAIHIKSAAFVTHKTGVEMEALTAASTAALTIYDMCKALSHDIRIEHIQLLNKEGGKRNFNR